VSKHPKATPNCIVEELEGQLTATMCIS